MAAIVILKTCRTKKFRKKVNQTTNTKGKKNWLVRVPLETSNNQLFISDAQHLYRRMYQHSRAITNQQHHTKNNDTSLVYNQGSTV